MQSKRRKRGSLPAGPGLVIGLTVGRWALTAVLQIMLFSPMACVFDEKSLPMCPGDLVRVPPPDERELRTIAGSTRGWLARTHRHLEHLLPERGKLVMPTEQMTDADGRPRDVYAYFQKDPATLNILTKNWYGITHTAQSASRSEAIDHPAPPWPGFKQVWIPVADEVELSGRLGFAQTDGEIHRADCIVLLPGLFGDNAVIRTRDLARALRSAGLHVLALELRGHGQTEMRYPDVYYNFGLVETQDLMKVSEWLEDHNPRIRGTGLVGFCWGGNLAMLAAWFDGRRPDDPSIPPDVARHLDPPCSRRHFAAGTLAFSPVLRWEEIMDLTDVQHDMWVNPSAFFFQETIKSRMRRKVYPEVSGNLRRLIAYEFARSIFTRSLPVDEMYQSLRFLPYRGLPTGDKLEFARTAVLMVTAVNDPFLCAQDLTDLMAMTENPRVAGLILRGGGHIGFGPYKRPYFYSLIINFFDPHSGAAACIHELKPTDAPGRNRELGMER